MHQRTIAIVADCDDTLAPDTTRQLLGQCGVDASSFFQDVSTLIKDGWDPSLAYMHKMIQLAADGGPLAGLTCQNIQEIGRRLEFYPGVPQCFKRIKREIEDEPTFRAVGIRVETYVVSAGIGQLLRSSRLSEVTPYIWGCDFAYGPSGAILTPKRVISFTDKTRFLFMINKGIVGPGYEGNPYVVNTPIRKAERPVPFQNMIYIGDGPSDIPSMSLIQSNEGFVIGVTSPANPDRAWALTYGRRANQTVGTNFTSRESAYDALRQAVLQRASMIANLAANFGPVPQH